MWLHQRWQRVSFITSQEINVTNLRDVKWAGKFCNSSHIKLESCFIFFFYLTNVEQIYARPWKRLRYLRFSSSSTAVLYPETHQCCILNLSGVSGVFQCPGVRRKQTRERWSCQRYRFRPTSGLTGTTQEFPLIHPVSSDRGAVQLYLLWLRKRGRSSWSWLDKTGSIDLCWELLIWGSLALEKDDRDVNNWGAKFIYTCALKSQWWY